MTPKPSASSGSSAPSASLAEDLQRLEEIVRQLERDDGDLDRSLALFEEGVARLRAARERLGEAETRVKKVLEDAQGTLRTEDVDASG
jgi:exodeoxyribonuclease VII small subunit